MSSNIFNFSMSIYGPEVNPTSNRWYSEGYSPCVGVYLWREVGSHHGDICEFPDWQKLTLPQYLAAYRDALADHEWYMAAVDEYWASMNEEVEYND